MVTATHNYRTRKMNTLHEKWATDENTSTFIHRHHSGIANLSPQCVAACLKMVNPVSSVLISNEGDVPFFLALYQGNAGDNIEASVVFPDNEKPGNEVHKLRCHNTDDAKKLAAIFVSDFPNAFFLCEADAFETPRRMLLQTGSQFRLWTFANIKELMSLGGKMNFNVGFERQQKTQ